MQLRKKIKQHRKANGGERHMKLNFKVRLKNKLFWTTMIPAVILLVTQVCKLFGLNLDLSGISSLLLDIVSTVFIILTILGIVNDPTTNGISDSDLAMTYEEPKR